MTVIKWMRGNAEKMDSYGERIVKRDNWILVVFMEGHKDRIYRYICVVNNKKLEMVM